MGLNHPLGLISTSPFSYDQDFIIFRQRLIDREQDGLPRRPELKPGRPNRNGAPTIGHDVWIGQDVMLARDVHLGHGSVIAAGSVVTKSVPPYAIVGGNPAKLIRFRFSEEIIESLLKSRWWDYDICSIGKTQYNDPESFPVDIARLASAGEIESMNLERFYFKDLFSS